LSNSRESARLRFVTVERFTSYAAYLRARHGERVYRVGVDAGFSCPHRSGDRLAGGCAFCGPGAARAPYLGPANQPRVGSPQALESLGAQVARSTAFLARRYKARAFVLYFQAFSNTYAPTAVLQRTYDSALASADFRALVVSTRPDCVDSKRADLLASYIRPDLEVWVELGLQSACERTLRRMRRGHGVRAFDEALGLLKARGLRVAPHLIFGLPGEGLEEIESTIDHVARCAPDGVKVHNLHVPTATPLAAEARAGEIALLSAARHLDYVIRLLERLSRSVVILRLTCDTPAGELDLPRRFPDKASFYRRLREELVQRDTWQGRLRGEPRPGGP
jgi:radical SAM protein (TIGR01212 family)